MSITRFFLQTLRQCCTSIACAPYFLFAVIFYSLYYCWPYLAQLPEHLSTVIVDEDQSALSRRLVDALESSPRLAVHSVTTSRNDAIDRMKTLHADSIIGIPLNFEADALAGIPTAMTLVTNGGFIVKARSSISGATAPLEELASMIVAEQLLDSGMPLSAVGRMSQQAPALIIQPMYNEISGYLNFVVPIVFMVVVQTLMLCGTGMLFNSWAEDPGKFHMLRLAFKSPACLLAAQGGVFAFSFFWLLFVEGATFALHGVNSFENIPATFAASICFAFAISSLGILAGVTLGTTRYVIQGLVPCSLPFVFISGNLFPWQNIPPYVQVLGWLTPTTPAADGMMRASQCGADIAQIFPYLGHLLFLGFLYLFVAMIIARWRSDYLPERI